MITRETENFVTDLVQEYRSRKKKLFVIESDCYTQLLLTFAIIY